MKLPGVTAGGLGGTLETGRTLDYLHAGDDKLSRFGDAETRLERL